MAPHHRRLRLEPLEQRTLLAAFTVSNTVNNASTPNSLPWAISQANANPGPDTINFTDNLVGATINTVNLLITDDVDIQGPLNGPVILSGPATFFHVFTGAGRILDIAAGANVSISRLTLKNGDVDNYQGFNPPGEAFGGAIRNAGTLTVQNSLFYHNGAGEPSEGFGGGGGGAIYNSGSLTVLDSSFAANFADWGSGGAIYNDGTASVINSTFIDNMAGYFGGTIFNNAGGTLTVDNSTILKSGTDFAALPGYPDGHGGISNLGTLTLNNTIVAHTRLGSDVENSGVLTGSHNLIEDGSGGLPGTITGDPMLTPPNYISVAPISQPLPGLLPRPGLAGPPFTVPPLPGSPVIDAGNNSAVSSFGDQRGAPRILNGVVDIGAVEVGIGPVDIVVTTLTDENDESIDPALGAGTSLREALSLKLPEDVLITFAPGLAGTIALDALSSLEITNFGGSPNGFPSQRGTVMIVGPGADVLTLDGLTQTRIMGIDNVDVSISGLTFARGAANDSVAAGGAIHNQARLTLNDCVFLNNTAASVGGAIYNGNSLIVNNCVFAGNSSDQGGAITNFANGHKVTVTDSTFTGNFARNGGAIWTKGFTQLDGSYIRPVIASSTFSENSATELGGAIYIASDRNRVQRAQLSVFNSTISNNSASNGGGIYCSGDLDLYGSTVYANAATASAAEGEVIGGGIVIADREPEDGLLNRVESVTLVNNVVAGSTSGADLAIRFLEQRFFGFGTVTSSHNLIGDGSGGQALLGQYVSDNGINFYWIYSWIDISAGMTNTITGDPKLGPLADNGGPTRTHALLPGSPAIDAGDPSAASGVGEVPLDDQRGDGFTRVIGNAIDLGAFELQTAELAGDYNRNGTVSAADYVLWRDTLGKTGFAAYAGADGNGNTTIDADDYVVWRRNFGSPSGGSGAGASIAGGLQPPQSESYAEANGGERSSPAHVGEFLRNSRMTMDLRSGGESSQDAQREFRRNSPTWNQARLLALLDLLDSLPDRETDAERPDWDFTEENRDSETRDEALAAYFAGVTD